jgi:hypothetical protein
MERACGRVYFIDEFFYLYNGFTGNNDNYINYGAQIDVVYKVKRKPKLECLPEYKNIPLFVWYMLDLLIVFLRVLNIYSWVRFAKW